MCVYMRVYIYTHINMFTRLRVQDVLICVCVHTHHNLRMLMLTHVKVYKAST